MGPNALFQRFASRHASTDFLNIAPNQTKTTKYFITPYLSISTFEQSIINLCKLGWALAAEDEKLWIQTVKAKYFPHTQFLKCRKKTTDSWHWKGILSTKPIIKKGIYWHVGKEDSIDYWEDLWIPLNPLFLPTPKLLSCLDNCGKVNSLTDAAGN